MGLSEEIRPKAATGVTVKKRRLPDWMEVKGALESVAADSSGNGATAATKDKTDQAKGEKEFLY